MAMIFLKINFALDCCSSLHPPAPDPKWKASSGPVKLRWATLTESYLLPITMSL
jgi:hypothetical protein